MVQEELWLSPHPHCVPSFLKNAFKPAREATVSRPPDAGPSEESGQPLSRSAWFNVVSFS